MKRRIFCFFVLFLLFACFYVFGFSFGKNDYIELISTDDIKKASEIETLVSLSELDTIRFIQKDRLIIALKNFDKYYYRELILKILYSDIDLENLQFNLDVVIQLK